MKNKYIVDFLKFFLFNPSCKEILDDLNKCSNHNKEELDDFVEHNKLYKVTLYKDDVSCFIQQIKEDRNISENIYKLLIDGKSEDNSICFSIYLKPSAHNGNPYFEYVDSEFHKQDGKNDVIFVLDTLVYFASFVKFLKQWFVQYHDLKEELYDEMPDFSWFFKVFLKTQKENFLLKPDLD